MHIFKYLVGVAAIVSPGMAHAQSDDDETIIVTANRGETPLSKVGQSVTVITADDIRTRQSSTVVDLLRITPGVTYNRNGGIGTTAFVNIRGSESDQTVALIDGVKINDPSAPGGGFNFGNLLTGNVERIEIVRGSQSVLWGSQAIGGVVNIILREPTDILRGNANAEYGWRDTGQLVGNISGKFGPVSGSIGAGYLRSDNISAFNEARGATERDGYRNFGGTVKIKIAFSDALSLDLRGWLSNSESAIDGFAPPTFAFGDSSEVAETDEMVGYAGLNLALLDGRLRNRIAYAYTQIDRQNLDVSGTAPFQTFAAEGENRRFEYQGSFDISAGTGLTFGAETEKSSYGTSSFGGPVARADVRISSLYGQIGASPVAGLTLTAGLRYDDHETFGGKTTFAANGVYSPNAGATLIRASYGEGFKTPSLFQLFSNFGNRTLRPELAQSWDVSVTQKALDGALEAAITWFHRDAENQIVFTSCPPSQTGICTNRPFGTYDNVARTRAQGLEFAMLVKPVAALTVQASYTWLDAENRASELRLARRPSHSVNAAIDYAWPFGLQTGATIVHVGDSFENAANSRQLNGYVLIDLRASMPVGHGISLYARVENLFDEQYETIFLYGTPRRAAYAGIRLGF